MAAIAAGALAAEQVIMTGVEVAAAVTVARPTQPLKGTLSQVTVPADDETSSDLARSHHSVTVIGDRAYIFGGQQADGQLCNTDVHAVTLPRRAPGVDPTSSNPNDEVPSEKHHDRYPAFPLKDATTGDLLVPVERTRHAAAARDKYLVVHGGVPATEDAATIWLWDSGTLKWTRVNATVQMGATLAPRWDHALFVDEAQDIMVMHGGRTADGPSAETWLYDFNTMAWMELPAAPVPSDASNAAFSDGTLYVVADNPGIEGSGSDLGGTVHMLRLGRSAEEREKAMRWERVDFPSNPIVAGPKVRAGGALVPVSTGYGRRYLAYMFGGAAPAEEMKAAERGRPQPEYHSDVWSLQVPSGPLTGASAKDAIRDALPGVESGALQWSELEIVPTEMLGHEGKAHPGPIASFGAASCLAGKGVFVWGGSTADGRMQGDGWILELS